MLKFQKSITCRSNSFSIEHRTPTGFFRNTLWCSARSVFEFLYCIVRFAQMTDWPPTCTDSSLHNIDPWLRNIVRDWRRTPAILQSRCHWDSLKLYFKAFKPAFSLIKMAAPSYKQNNYIMARFFNSEINNYAKSWICRSRPCHKSEI